MSIGWNDSAFKAKTVEEAKKRLLQRGLQVARKAGDILDAVVYATPESPFYKRTGLLKKIAVLPAEQDGNLIKVRVGPQADYGIYNEFGTSKMAARPFMRPALEAVKADIRSDGL